MRANYDFKTAKKTLLLGFLTEKEQAFVMDLIEMIPILRKCKQE